jgi:hypothetical protein
VGVSNASSTIAINSAGYIYLGGINGAENITQTNFYNGSYADSSASGSAYANGYLATGKESGQSAAVIIGYASSGPVGATI